MPLTRKDLARMISEATGRRPYHGIQTVNVVFEAMREALAQGNRIEIRGFGAFTIRSMKPRPRARNPLTGETIYVPARRKVHFKPGKLIRQELDKPREKGTKQ